MIKNSTKDNSKAVSCNEKAYSRRLFLKGLVYSAAVASTGVSGIAEKGRAG